MNLASASYNQQSLSTDDVGCRVNQWFEAVKARHVNTLMSLLCSDVRLTVPFQTEVILGNVNTLNTFKVFDQVVNNFSYNSVLIDGNTAALRFDGDINEEHLQGVDFFHFNSAGQVDKIEVMARPLIAINYLHETVKQESKGQSRY